MDEKLEHCPFCGSTNVALKRLTTYIGSVHCNDCTADVVFDAVRLGFVKDGGEWREIMTKGWNRRADNADR